MAKQNRSAVEFIVDDSDYDTYTDATDKFAPITAPSFAELMLTMGIGITAALFAVAAQFFELYSYKFF